MCWTRPRRRRSRDMLAAVTVGCCCHCHPDHTALRFAMVASSALRRKVAAWAHGPRVADCEPLGGRPSGPVG
eukprot:11065860-Alexandrium_andersonii.AAC.1